ncbi:MAG: DNA primase [Methanobacteriota archaeon]
MQASETTKYFIHANLRADGVVERSDVVGAIYGQTEGLLGEDLDLRDLQDSDKISRMEVDVGSSNGSSRGTVTIGSSLDRVETSVLAASLETIERIGPCEATVEVELVEDVRTTKRKEIVERAKYIHREMFDGAAMGTGEMLDEVRKGVRKGDITEYAGLPAGPNVKDSDAVLVVEGRADVLNLLKYGVKNAVGVEGTDVPDTVAELTQDRTVTAFLDSDRGGDLILKELGQVADIDYVAHPPDGRCVEDLSGEEINEALRDKRIFGGSEASDGAESGKEPAGARKTDGTESTEAGERKRTEAVETEGTGEAGEPKNADETEGEQEELPFVEKLRDADNGEAVLLDGERHEVGRVECDDFAEALRNGDGEVDSIVVGNEIDQRVLDAASQGNVETVVGSELGTVVKKPLDINVVTETELP